MPQWFSASVILVSQSLDFHHNTFDQKINPLPTDDYIPVVNIDPYFAAEIQTLSSQQYFFHSNSLLDVMQVKLIGFYEYLAGHLHAQDEGRVLAADLQRQVAIERGCRQDHHLAV